MTVIEFADAESAVLTYLRQKVPDIKSGTQLPPSFNSKFDTFIRIERQGGSMKFPILDRATLDVQVYARTRQQGHDTLQHILSLLSSLRHAHLAKDLGVRFSKMTVYNAPLYAPDPVTFDPRWIATVNLVCRPLRQS